MNMQVILQIGMSCLVIFHNRLKEGSLNVGKSGLFFTGFISASMSHFHHFFA